MAVSQDAGSTTSNFIRYLKTHLIAQSLGNVTGNLSAPQHKHFFQE